MQEEKPPQVTMLLRKSANAADKMATLLQRGILLPVQGRIPLVELLTGLPGFTEEYLNDRVQTIFVNGLAEDNTCRQLAAGDTVALSAAMPGLAGAIFRRGGQHGSLRTRPTRAAGIPISQSGYITLKLFNMIATETGPELLRQGVLIRGATLARFLQQQGKRIQPALELLAVDNVPLDLAGLTAAAVASKFLFLKGAIG